MSHEETFFPDRKRLFAGLTADFSERLADIIRQAPQGEPGAGRRHDAGPALRGAVQPAAQLGKGDRHADRRALGLARRIRPAMNG